MVIVAQLVRAPDCGSGGRRFETGLSPEKVLFILKGLFFISKTYILFNCSINSPLLRNETGIFVLSYNIR